MNSATQQTQQTIAAIAVTLNQAAAEMSTLARSEGPSTSWFYHRLSTDLVTLQAVELLPLGYDLEACGAHPGHPRDLIAAAETLSRDVVIDQNTPAGFSSLVVGILDLLSELP